MPTRFNTSARPLDEDGQSAPSGLAVAQPASTRERLLDAAEQLFGEHGFNGASVREIAKCAQTTLGSIPYYFASKEKLFKEVFLRRMAPVQAERRRRLQALTASQSPPTVEDVLRAMLEPVFRTSRENDAFRRLAGRAAVDPTPTVQAVMAEVYNADFVVTPQALRRACPGLPDDVFYWRLFCVYGVMVYVQADTGKMQTIAGERFDTSHPEIALQYVIPFLAGGLRASYSGPKSGGGNSKKTQRRNALRRRDNA